MTSTAKVDQRKKEDQQVMFAVVFAILFVLLIVYSYVNRPESAYQNPDPTNKSQMLWNSILQYLQCFSGKQGIMFATMIYLFAAMNYAMKHQDTFYKSKVFFLGILIIPMAFLGNYMLMENNGDQNKSYYVVIGIVAGLMGLYLFMSNYGITASMISTAGYFLSFLLVFIVLIGMAIAYTMFLEKMYDSNGLTGFIVGLLFYLPCMIRDFLSWISKEITGTPMSIYMLFIIELLLILSYFHIPRLYKKILDRDGKTVLEDATVLANKVSISNYVELFGDPTIGKDIIKSSRNLLQNTYAVSFWVYPYPNPLGKEYQTRKEIFTFGLHPMITYDGKTDTFYIKSGTKGEEDFKLLPNRWNHIAINYQKNSVDLFVNGSLTRSLVPRNNTDENIAIGDSVTVGDENGVGGGIRKVVFYKQPLTAQEISTINYLGTST
jgi:uncharacterized membrane protein